MRDILAFVGQPAGAIGARSERSRSDVGGISDAFATALDAPADKQKGEAIDARRRLDQRMNGQDEPDHRTRLPFADRMAKTLAALEARQQQGGTDAIRLPDPPVEDQSTTELPDPAGAIVRDEAETEPTAASDVDLIEEGTSGEPVQADALDQLVISTMPVVSRQEPTPQPQASAGAGEHGEATRTVAVTEQAPATRPAEAAATMAPRGLETAAAAAVPLARGAAPADEGDPRTSTRREPAQVASTAAASPRTPAGQQPASQAQLSPQRTDTQAQAAAPSLPLDAAAPEAQPNSLEPRSELASETTTTPKVQVVASSGIVAPAAVATSLPGPAQQLTSAMLATVGTSEAPATNPAVPAPEAVAARPAALHSLTIQLQPAELGRVLARMTISDGQLTVAVQVETTEAHQRISTDRDILSNALRSAGYEVDRIIVQQVQPGQAAQSQTLQGDQNRNTGNGFQATGEGPGGRGDGGANQGGSNGRPAPLAASTDRVGQGDGGSLYI